MSCPKIFIIEDDQPIRTMLQVCLESEGYEVESFENGKTALDALHNHAEPCLILLDLMMPVMNGKEFMLEFLKLPATIVPIPVYLCSASVVQGESEKMGYAGFVKKPVDLDLLLEIVKKYCTNSLL